MADSTSIARRAGLLRELDQIQLTNEKRVAQAQQIVDAAANFDEAAAVASAKQQVAQQLQTANVIISAAVSDATVLTDTAGRYKDLFADIDADAAANPTDLAMQYQKSLKDSFVAQAESHKAVIADAAKAVDSQAGVFTVDVKPVPLPPVIMPPVLPST